LFERPDSGERAALVHITFQGGRGSDNLDEFTDLAVSAGALPVATVTGRRRAPDPGHFIGRGKLEELRQQIASENVEVVIFDHALTPAQERNLEARLGCRVLDRIALILDIFAQNAKTRDGKLQVELAQLKYMLPRLAQKADRSLSRLAGGIGGRGPGETKLEVDRRRVRARVARLEREVKKLGKQRVERRRRRKRRAVPVLSIVGYTNAGKSTLLRALTRTEVHVEEKMFATLDPTSRRLRFPREREVIITDTVGFIRDLPKDLMAAFHATLEELSDANLLLHVVDASAHDFERRIDAVHGVLEEIGLADKPELLVFNQIDRLPGGVEGGVGTAIARRFRGVAVSALENLGLEELVECAQNVLWSEAPVRKDEYENRSIRILTEGV